MKGTVRQKQAKKKYIFFVIYNAVVKPTLPLNIFCNLHDFVIVQLRAKEKRIALNCAS